MSNEQEDISSLTEGILIGLCEGSVAVPHLLIKYYRKLDLSETDAMLLIQLMAFKSHDQTDFPTIEQLQSRMHASGERVIESLRKLLKRNLLSIDEETDELSGIRYERYNLRELLRALAAAAASEYAAGLPVAAAAEAEGGKDKNIFTVFEREFARPLSPMECETISNWLDKDRYKEELILFALKEAVFAGKLHFRYIDRILLEWGRNRVSNVEQAKEYARRFRGERF